MQLAKGNSKKWVDYSDSSDDDADSGRQNNPQPAKRQQVNRTEPVTSSTQPKVDPTSPQYKQQQLKRLHQCPPYHKDVWIEVMSNDQTALDKKIMEFKDNQHPDISQIFMSKEIKGGWDLKVKKQLAEKWIEEGVQGDNNIQVAVAQKNLKPREERNYEDRGDRGDRGGRGRGAGRGRGGHDRGDRGDRGERGERGERRGRGRGGREQNGQRREGDREGGDRRRRGDREQGGQKKVYVDKVTGKAPTNKQDVEKTLLVQKQRHYSKTEAEKVGLGLANFRNKPKTESKPQEDEPQFIKKESREVPFKNGFQRKYQEPHTKKQREPKGEVKMWARKQRNDQPEQKTQKTHVKYVQKDVDPSKQTEKNEKKQKYVRVDDMSDEQRQQLKKKQVGVTEVEKDHKQDFLSQDST